MADLEPLGLGALRIHPATEADLAGLALLAAQIWRACYPEIISAGQIEYMLDRMYSLEVLRRELREGVRYVLLSRGGEKLGFAAFGPTVESAEFKLHKLYLRPEWHGKGLGSLLLGHCESEVLLLAGRRLALNVNRGNQKAIRAYERNGFQVIRAVVTDIGGGYVMDDLVMAKELKPSSVRSASIGNST